MNFFHRLFNPHCPECKAEDIARQEREDRLIELREQREYEQIQDSRICQGCENSKLEIARCHDEIRLLIEKLTDKPAIPVHTGPAEISKPRATTMPWSVRKSMLENASRERAAALQNAAKSDTAVKVEVTTEELEKEMGVVEKEREEKTGTENV